MTRTTEQWEKLLDGLEGVSLSPMTVTCPAFDDNPDQSDVHMPAVRVEGLAGWGIIDTPQVLQGVVSASIESAAEVIRLRKALEEALAVCEDGDTHRHVAFAKIIARILDGDTE